MRNENTDETTPIPATIDPTQLENVTGGCNGAVGGCTCGPGKDAKPEWPSAGGQ